MGCSDKSHLARGIVAGAVGGLVASLAMNQFMESVGPSLQKLVQTSPENQAEEPQQAHQENEPKEDATMKAADAIVTIVTGGKHLSVAGKRLGGPIVHYGFGAVMGALYGAFAEHSANVRAGYGSVYGGVVFATADMIAVPALKLSSSSKGQPISSLASPFAAHLVYGVTTELVRRMVRTAL